MPSLEPLMRIEGKLQFVAIGATPSGTRIDVPFEGVATSDRWEGELPVAGVDYVTVRADGTAALVIRARMGEGDRMVSYSATGRMGPDGLQEVLTFETASEEFAFLNVATAVAIGSVDGNKLSLDVYTVQA